MELFVLRDPNSIATPGRMLIDTKVFCYTLEPSQKNPIHPAIPDGTYKIELRDSPHFGFELPHILNVPGREWIEIHPLNQVSQTEGCCGVGFDHENNVLLESRAAFDALMGQLKGALALGEVLIITYGGGQ